MPQLVTPAHGAGVDLSTPAARASAVERAVEHLDASPPGAVGALRVELAVAAGATEVWTLDFSGSGVRLAPDQEPDAVLRASVEDVLDLVAGRADGALLHLAQRLEVSGDESFVLALGTAVRVPGADRALIDPASLDPEAVSSAIAGVDVRHLAAVMSGGFRELVLAEVFRRIPEFLVPEKAERVSVSVAFEIEREPEGEAADRYVVRIVDGLCTVIPYAGPEVAADATLVLEGQEFLRLVLGHLNPVRGVLSGQIRVRGQVIKALGFHSVVNIPGS
ncbi:putative sterol carrier protein [Marmoricola sp. OAE513]|uniref:SCP2 sterol-binding domain-containing protein n=1 Tax=Marmoricola sp. OAE513 TaxID=2817894 RepID=UPI001AE90016